MFPQTKFKVTQKFRQMAGGASFVLRFSAALVYRFYEDSSVLQEV